MMAILWVFTQCIKVSDVSEQHTSSLFRVNITITLKIEAARLSETAEVLAIRC